MLEYAALVASPRALPDGMILVFQHPVKTEAFGKDSISALQCMPIQAVYPIAPYYAGFVCLIIKTFCFDTF
jgi:hypothetical protein